MYSQVTRIAIVRLLLEYSVLALMVSGIVVMANVFLIHCYRFYALTTKR
jgi:hypothetical protein